MFVEQLLEQLFAFAQAGVDDLDVLSRKLAGEADHLFGEIADLDRLAHVEREDLPALPQGGRLQDQLAGLRNGHEVAADFRMGHGDRATLTDLLAEQRHHAAGRIQHIAEAHGEETGARALRQVLAEDLGDALGSTHHIGGIDGLVRGNQHEGLDAGLVRRQCDGARTQHVVAEGLAQLLLQQRHVLVGCCVKHDLRPQRLHHMAAGRGIAHIAERRIQFQVGKLAAQLAFDLVKVVFGLFQNAERRCAKARDLTAQLRTDRTATAGYQHALARQRLADRSPIQLYRFAAKQVFDRDFFQFIECRAPRHYILQARYGAERQSGLFAQLDHAPHFGGAGARHCDQQHVGGDFTRQFAQFLYAPEHWNAVDAGAAQHSIVVEEADRQILAFGTKVAHQHFTCAFSAEHQHALARTTLVEVEAAVLPEAIRQPGQPQQHGHQYRIQHQHAARHIA